MNFTTFCWFKHQTIKFSPTNNHKQWNYHFIMIMKFVICLPLLLATATVSRSIKYLLWDLKIYIENYYPELQQRRSDRPEHWHSTISIVLQEYFSISESKLGKKLLRSENNGWCISRQSTVFATRYWWTKYCALLRTIYCDKNI